MQFSFDPVQLLAGIGALLLITGTIPFTATSVGVLLILSMCRLTFTWER